MVNLPVYLTTFIGRNTELNEIRTQLANKTARLLTLLGPGGAGKTRTAVEALAGLGEIYEDGVLWVELEHHFDPVNIAQIITNALHLPTAPGQSAEAALYSYFQHREMLVVLDNCEHLIKACAQLIGELLHTCPNLYFLATSRETLGVAGEQAWLLPPLPYPAEPPAAAISDSPASITRFAAIDLFFSRSKNTNPAFEITTDNLPALIRISQLLNGIPLSIELAASWSNVMDVHQIARRLEDQLSFLVKRKGSQEPRHQSLRETINWSYALLSEPEKILFRRLSVFKASFTLEAVEAVCKGAPLSRENISVLFAHLVDKSLVVWERTRAGIAYYRLLESVYQYAREKMGQNEEEAAFKTHHFSYYSDLVERAAPQLLGPNQENWIDRLDADYDNLHAALDFGLHQSRRRANTAFRETMTRMVNGLYWLWDNTTRYQQGRDWYQCVLDLPGHNRQTPQYADLLRNLATLTWLLGDYKTAASLLQESIASASQAEYSYGIGHAKLLSGIMALHQRQPELALPLLVESEQRFRALGETRGLAIACVNLGGAYTEIGDDEKARHYTEEAAELARTNRDAWALALALSGLGNLVFQQGESGYAFRLMDEAQELFQQLGQKWLLAEAVWRGAEMRRALGQYALSENEFERCYALAQESGSVQWEIAALESLGEVSLARGNKSQALGYFVEILRKHLGAEFIPVQMRIIARTILLAGSGQQWEQASTLWGVYQRLGESLTQPAQPIPLVEQQLQIRMQDQPQTPLNARWVETGKKMSMEQVARLVIEISKIFSTALAPSPGTERLLLLALGPAEAHLNGRLLLPADWTFAKPKELLFYLALNPPATKEQLGLVFWPDASPAQLRSSLRATLYQLRRTLGGGNWIVYQNGHYAFNHAMDYWLDVEAFEHSLQEAKNLSGSAAAGAIEKLGTARKLYRGDLLEGISGDGWATLRREELKHKFLDGMLLLGQLYLDTGAPEQATEVYRTLLGHDNLLEKAHRGIMQAYTLNGKREAALRHYQTLVKILQEHLGIAPAEETTNLYRAIQQGSF